MILHLLFCCVLNTGLYSANDDLELAKKFAPVVINEISESKEKQPSDTKIDSVFYDVAYTETNVYISYQLMRSWSFFEPVIPPSWWNANHPIDSEDIFLVLARLKKGENITYIPLFYATNAHGKRLVYVFEAARVSGLLTTEENQDFNMDELSFYGEHNADIESSFASRFMFTKKTKQVLDNKSKEYVSICLDDKICHPLVLSTAGMHALTRGYITAPDPSKEAAFEIAVPENFDKLNKYSSIKISHYKLEALKDVIPTMTFDHDVAKKTPEKVEPCQPWHLKLNGRQITSPPLPTHFDPRWYLTRYNPELLRAIETDPKYAKDKDKYLNVPEADTAYNHGYLGPDTKKDPKTKKDVLTNCQRLDPANVFKMMFRETYRAMLGSSDDSVMDDYIKYDLMSTVWTNGNKK